MCGIAGVMGHSTGPAEAAVTPMVAALHHRGPDDAGVWSEPAVGLGLGHARLSILDLSVEGHQPMASASGRYVISYNGEVYNFADLRRELESHGAGFRGHSDTEIMLAAFEQWGVQKAVERFVGMFAFAVWDRRERMLHLVRDRIGIKPLYYGWAGCVLLFASELKAFMAYPGFQGEINRAVLPTFLQLSCVPSPQSIFQRVYKLPPGCLLTLAAQRGTSHDGFSSDPDDPAAAWKPVRYWSAAAVVERGAADPFTGSDEEAIAELDRLLREAVRIRMVADVPLGAFLSGGVDSSTVVALMQAQSARPVRTYTIGFHETDYNEAAHAKSVAAHLGTDHTELYVTPKQAQDVIPRLPALYDEPFADSSQIPTFLVSELARQSVTVSLSGDGGDELFGGYNRYTSCDPIWRMVGWLPVGLRRVMAAGLWRLSPQQWTSVYGRAGQVLPWLPQVRLSGDKIHKLAEVLVSRNPEEMYFRLAAGGKGAEEVLPGPVPCLSAPPALRELAGRMMYWDLTTYLHDDILAKLDRASMGVSLEARVPLLDHRVVAFVWRLPLSMKIRAHTGKWLLRCVLDRYVPRPLIERPKMGFAVPIDHWLRGPLRDWAEHLLDERRLREEGLFDPSPIRRKWAEHLSGRFNWQSHLWDILMFQAWKNRWTGSRCGSCS